MSVPFKNLDSVPAPALDVDLSALGELRGSSVRRRVVVNTLRVLFLVILIGGWELGARAKIIDPFFWGQPSGIWAQIVTWVTEGTAQGPLWKQIAATLQEAVYGFLIGVVLGVIFGVVLGTNRFLADILGPFIKAANSIPRVVLGSVFVIGMGFGIESKVALAVVLVFFIVFFNAFQGVREVDRDIIANARILGASRRQLTTSVILPAALTWIIASLHTSFSFALVGAVVGEYLGALEGMGLMIQTAQANFNNNGVFAALVILAVLALTAEALITWLENRLIRWRPNMTTEGTL
ncbi:MAG TPA: ABC transporter permease [Ktedonobacterales bacterium]